MRIRNLLMFVTSLAFLTAWAAGGLSERRVLAAGQVTESTQPEPEVQPPVTTIDDRFADVARQIPAFGGMFFDRQRRLTMYLVESRLAVSERGRQTMEAAGRAVTSLLRGDDRVAGVGNIRILRGRYSYLELKTWHDTMAADVLSAAGVISADIAESSNRLRIGVGSPAARLEVEQRLARLGVPGEAVLIDIAEPVQLVSHTLRSKVRPLTGGLQIHFGNFLCTLGVIAIRGGVLGMVNNSHCTNVQGGVEGTVYHQATASGTTNRIGREGRDPVYFVGGICPPGRRCRWSDTSFARIPHPSGPAVAVSRGFIARTNGLGSITINHAAPRFRIVGEAGGTMHGELLNKIGRTTGWSRGVVTGTCIDTNVSGTNITQFCQDFVNASVGPGDSGSPVFRITNAPASGDVRLYGILWGSNSGGNQFVFSPIGATNVQRGTEMGAVTTCAPGFGC